MFYNLILLGYVRDNFYPNNTPGNSMDPSSYLTGIKRRIELFSAAKCF